MRRQCTTSLLLLPLPTLPNPLLLPLLRRLHRRQRNPRVRLCRGARPPSDSADESQSARRSKLPLREWDRLGEPRAHLGREAGRGPDRASHELDLGEEPLEGEAPRGGGEQRLAQQLERHLEPGAREPVL